MKLLNKLWKMVSVTLSLVLLVSMLIAGTPAKALTQPVVTLGNPQPGQVSEYDIWFELDKQLTLGDTITITFPNDTVVPSGYYITPDQVTVQATNGWFNGLYTAADLTALIITGDAAARTVTISFSTPSNQIGEGAGVKVVIKTACGLVNPSQADDYTLAVHTSQETSDKISNIYSIPPVVIGPDPEEVNTPIVVLDNPQPGQSSGYVVRFTANKALSDGDEVVVTLPLGTILDAGASATIRGTDGWIQGFYLPSIMQNPGFSVNTAERTITATLGPGDRTGEGSEIRIEIVSGITNPSSPGIYSLTVHTSQETIPVSSEYYAVPSQPPYYIPVSVTQPEVTLSTAITGQESMYVIRFAINRELLDTDDIVITFPQGTTVNTNAQAIIMAADGWVNGYYQSSTLASTGYSVDSTERSLTFTLGSGDQIGAGAEVRIQVQTGIHNPLAEGPYTLTARTTEEPDMSPSYVYDIVSDYVPPIIAYEWKPFVSLDDYSVGQVSEYTILFTNDMALSESDTITIKFPHETGISDPTATLQAGPGWINMSWLDSTTSGVTVTSDSVNRTITFRLGAGDAIGECSEVRVHVSNGIVNPSIAGDYTLEIGTSTGFGLIESMVYTLPCFGVPVVFQPVAIDTAVIDEEAVYTIKFFLLHELSETQQIVITFPAYTQIGTPTGTVQASNGWNSGVYSPGWLNGASITSNPAERQIIVTLASGNTIGEGAEVRIQITDGITNPPEIKDYSLLVHTSQVTSPVASPLYSIVEPGVTPLPGTVTLYNSDGYSINTWNGNGAIQSALNAATVPGSTIEIGEGTYTEDPVIPMAGLIITTGDMVEDVIVQGTWTTGFTSSSVETIIDGLTLRPGAAGGSVMNITGDNVTVENCIVTKTEIIQGSPAGEILISSSGDDLTIRGCSFDTTDGDVADKAVIVSDGSVLVEYCTFNLDENTAGQDDIGIEITSTDPYRIMNCGFYGSSGKGVLTGTGPGGVLHCHFEYLDTGIFVSETIQQQDVMNCMFLNTDYGIVISGNHCTLANNIIRGSQIAAVYVPSASDDDLLIANNTIADNTGYGIYCDVQPVSGIVNNIIWNNGDDLLYCNATYSDISDGDTGEGNISQDPVFVDAVNGNYHLQSSSPCIDSGNNDTVVTDIDFDDEARIMDGDANGSFVIDMGADEYPGATQIPALADPDDVAFHGVLLGDYLELTTLVTNGQGAVFNVTGAMKTSGSSEFTCIGPSVPFAINPGQSVAVTIRYTPVSEIAANATFSLTTDAPGDQTLTFDVFGYGVVMLYNPGGSGGIPGDADGNGIVNVLDITKIARIILGLE